MWWFVVSWVCVLLVVFCIIIMNLFLCWLLLVFICCSSEFKVLLSIVLNSLVSLCVIIVGCLVLNVVIMLVSDLVMWCEDLQNISVWVLFVSLFNCLWWFVFLVGRKFLKVKWLLGRLVMFKVVIVVYVFGIGLIWMFVLCVVWIRWQFGLFIRGVLVLLISVNDFLVCSCVMICCDNVFLLWLCSVISGCWMLKWVSSWLLWWVFLVQIVVIECSIFCVCGVRLVRFLIGVVMIYSVGIVFIVMVFMG